MQIKPNFPNAQMNISTAITTDYVNIRLRSRFKNKAKQSQTNPIKPNFKPNLLDAQMLVSFVKTRNYNNEPRTTNNEQLCKSNPIKPNFKPVPRSDSTVFTFPFLLFTCFSCLGG